MQIEKIATFHGPNTFSHNPVLVMTLDLQDLAGKESCNIPGFVDRLIAAIPGLEEHFCGLGRRGGFIERLRGGTYFGHIVEHVALELTDAVGISVNRGKTVETDRPGVYRVGVEFRSEAGMRCLLRAAVDFVQALVHDQPFNLEKRLEEARESVARDELGPSTKSIIDAATMRNIPWRRLNEASLIELGYGRHRRFIEAALTSNTSAIAVDIASDKDLTKRLLASAEVPAPQGRIVMSEAEAVTAYKELGIPLVVKPLDANQGKGVTLGVSSEEEVREAYRIAAGFSKRVIVEEFFEGHDYRVLVIAGKMVAAACRAPARVVGDGVHSVSELIQEVNRDPLRSGNHGSPLSRIDVDDVVLTVLKKQGLTLQSIPDDGREVKLRENANLSTGGYAADMTDKVHPDFRKFCERAARTIGLDICGVDLIVPDISKPYTTGGIVEVNAAPGLRMHLHPTHGEGRAVGAAIMDAMYPNGSDGRIPIASITGTNGKTTTTRLLAHIMAQTGVRVGMTTTDGIWIGNEQIAHGDTTGPRSAHVVLSDTSVDCAVLETARGGIVRGGLGYDWSDVGIMTNIKPDHIGQDGIHSLDDIVRIKSLVAERVKPGGVLILNADDPELVRVPDRAKVRRSPKKIVWFSMEASTPLLNDHRTMGGTAYFPRDGWLIEAIGIGEKRLFNLADAPLTFGGMAAFQVANVMAAVAGARAMGADENAIREALMTFDSEGNPGRVNLWKVRSGYLLVDYGHNTAAIEAIASMVQGWGAERLSAVVALPGDRADSIIEEAAAAIGRGFDRVVLREDRDLRGRAPGEVPAIIRRTVEQVRPSCQIEMVPDEDEAVAHVVQTMAPGEVAVVLCETCHDVNCLLKGYEHERVAQPDAAYLSALRRTFGGNQVRSA